jgi:hypothetical protein
MYVYLARFNEDYDDQIWYDLEELLTSPDFPYVIKRRYVKKDIDRYGWSHTVIKKIGQRQNAHITITKIKMK